MQSNNKPATVSVAYQSEPVLMNMLQSKPPLNDSAAVYYQSCWQHRSLPRKFAKGLQVSSGP